MCIRHRRAHFHGKTVLVAPERPEISKEPEGHVVEGEFISIECESNSGNPPPTFTWRFSNNTEVPKEWFQVKPATPSNSVSSSILQ